MRFYVTQWSATKIYGSLSVYNHPLPSERNRTVEAQWFKFYFMLFTRVKSTCTYTHTHVKITQQWKSTLSSVFDRKNFRCLFTSSTKSRINNFYVVIVKCRQEKCTQKCAALQQPVAKMLRHSHEKPTFVCLKSLMVTGLWDITLTSLLPPIQSCSSKFWVWSCIASNFVKGWRGDHKHKIMDRLFMPKYGTESQVLLQLVVAWN